MTDLRCRVCGEGVSVDKTGLTRLHTRPGDMVKSSTNYGYRTVVEPEVCKGSKTRPVRSTAKRF
jgi:hypothetical protein